MSEFLYNHVRDYDHIIWDWNGTLLADLFIVVDVLKEQLASDGMQAPSEEEYRKIFSFPVYSFYQTLGYKELSPQSFAKKSRWYMDRYYEKFKTAKLYEGTQDLFARLKREGKTLSILSLAEQDHLREAVAYYSLDSYVDHVYGLDNVLGFSKVERGKELVKAASLPKEKTIFLGDTSHDYEVANSLGVDELLIADGYQTYERLSELGCKVIPSRYQVH